MRGDQIISTQLLMAQGFGALADLISNSAGYAFTPVPLASLSNPDKPPMAGMVASFNDSSVTGWGQVVAGGGFHVVLAFYNGTDWKVIGA
jgi:hypothetical protein